MQVKNMALIKYSVYPPPFPFPLRPRFFFFFGKGGNPRLGGVCNATVRKTFHSPRAKHEAGGVESDRFRQMMQGQEKRKLPFGKKERRKARSLAPPGSQGFVFEQPSIKNDVRRFRLHKARRASQVRLLTRRFTRRFGADAAADAATRPPAAASSARNHANGAVNTLADEAARLTSSSGAG